MGISQDSKVISCTCINEVQDKLYGKGNRLGNNCKPKSVGQKFYRCTVCLKEHQC